MALELQAGRESREVRIRGDTGNSTYTPSARNPMVPGLREDGGDGSFGPERGHPSTFVPTSFMSSRSAARMNEIVALGHRVGRSFPGCDDELDHVLSHAHHASAVQGKSTEFVEAPVSFVAQAVNEARRTTLLDPKLVDTMAEEQPENLAWLRSLQGFLAQWVVFVTFVGIDVGKAIFTSKALKGTATVSQSIAVAQAAIQVCLGLLTAFLKEGPEGMYKAFDLKQLMQYAPSSALFSMSQAFQLQAYRLLAPGTCKILGQIRLMQTAALSYFVFGRRYVQTQWLLMIILVLAVCTFFMSQMLSVDFYDADEMVGTCS